MRIVDVPVGFEQIFFVLEIEGFRGGAAWLKTVDLAGNARDFIKLCLRDRYFVDRTRADRAAVVQVCAVVLFIGN